MKIERDKKYVLSTGNIIRILATDSCGYSPCVAEDMEHAFIYFINLDGEGTTYEGSPVFITKEYIKPKFEFDWDCLPDWAEWIVMTFEGDWFYLKEKTDLVNARWKVREEYNGKIPHPYAPKNYYGTWEDSLTQRPQ